MDCVVIGGGFAGLSAAVRLASRGARVTVVEARPTLGGRANTFADPDTGEAVDNGQHVLFGCYHETLAFLATIGTADEVWFQQSLEVAFVDPDGRRSTLRVGGLPPPWHLIAALVDWDALGGKDRWSALRIARPLRVAVRQLRGDSRQIAASPGETVENWLIRNGQSARIREMLWDPLALAALNQHPRTAAAPIFAGVLARLFGSDPRDAALGLSKRPLLELYAEPARRYLEARGSSVRTGASAQVAIGPDGLASVWVRDERLDARAIVAAVPWFGLKALLSGDASPALSRVEGSLADIVRRASAMEASPIVTVNLWLDRQVVDAPFLGLPGRSFQWVFAKNGASGHGPSHLALVSSGADRLVNLSNDELVRIALDDLTRALPEASAAVIQRARAIREKQATFSLAPNQPPRPATRTPVANLFLAGEWIDTGLPGTIESAVVSGHRAALEVERYCQPH
ncbi:MAG: FAD-dependent oxidoreductase [Acidobacteria bacterium]|nr:FAD-dependent oxidoreductase [Acidobacteriota bacterium]